jgi:hypothetical protein
VSIDSVDPSRCPPSFETYGASPTVACGAIPAGVPSELTVSFDDCGCASHRCEATVTGDHELTLETWNCSDPTIDCACIEGTFFDAVCPLPPLDPGHWEVRIGEFHAFDFDTGPVLEGTRCHDVAVPFTDVPSGEGVGEFCRWPGERSLEPILVCMPEQPAVNTFVPMNVRLPMDSCAIAGHCTVTRTGEHIHVVPFLRDCATLEMCVPGGFVDHTCHTPRLEAGEYTVTVEGSEATFRIRVEGAGSDVEVCGPVVPR